MATIQLKRNKEFQSGLRDYQVFVDNEKIGTIGNNETKEFSVPIGQHQMVVKIDWCSSQIFNVDLADGETQNIQVEGAVHKGWWYKIFISLIFVEFIYIGITNTDFTRLLSFPISFIPIILYYLYYVTIGRKKYLILSLVN
jgi:hypothetical protein